MNSLTLVVCLHASLLTGPVNYQEAHAAVQESDKPLVVLVGADWCPACVQMKGVLTPEFERRAGRERVVFARVDADRQPGLSRSLMRGQGIPQLVMYRRTAAGWRVSRLLGFQSSSAVESFIAQGISEAVTKSETHAEHNRPAAAETAKPAANTTTTNGKLLRVSDTSP